MTHLHTLRYLFIALLLLFALAMVLFGRKTRRP